LFETDEHVEVEATWGIYQRMSASDREPDRALGCKRMVQLVQSVSHGVPKVLTKITTLGRPLKKQATDGLACVDRPGTSDGPTEASNGRLEHLCDPAHGFLTLTNDIARRLLETGGFRPKRHPRSCSAGNG
jgi:transposase